MFTSFRTRLFILFLVLAASVLIATLAAVTVATSSQAERTVERELGVSERVLIELLRVRGEQLLQAAQVLADDFGFREAVAVGDRETLISAMVNHGDRIGTQLMALYRPDGSELASTHALDTQQMLAQPRGVQVIDGGLYQLVTVPVRAPDLIAYATLGFVVDDALALSLQRLTNADLTFYSETGHSVFASSLTTEQQQGLVAALAANNLSQWLETAELAAHVTDFNETGLLVSTSRKDAVQGYVELRQQYLGFGLAAMLVALLLAFITARWIHRPLSELTKAAKRLGKGDFTAPIQIKQRDEFGRLGDAFNRMRNAIAEREERILYQSKHDLLTDLPNRSAFQQTFNTRIQATESGCLLVVNIQHFRAINDRLGQRFGDQVLQEVAQRLQRLFPEAHQFARLAGDEFVLTTESAAQDRVKLDQRLQQFAKGPWQIGGTSYRLEFRCGLVCYPQHGSDSDTLIRRAELAAHAAHQQSSLWSEYQAGSDEAYLRRLQILQALPEAIERRDLHLHYQPKLASASGQVLGVEALVRWQHPQLGVVRPDEFIPLAEQSGDILRVSRWVVETALNQQQLWLEQGYKLHMAINLSAVDLQSEQLVEFIQAQLQQRHLPPQQLTLEVTESAVMADPQLATARLQQLRAIGVKVALDDFGTGYASLAQLKQLPIDELKLDQSFIRELPTNSQDQVIVHSTLALAHALGLQLVAEGVEEAAAWQLLRDFDCDTVQGYYFSRPLAAPELIHWLQQQAPQLQQALQQKESEQQP